MKKLGFGCMRFPTKGLPTNIDKEELTKMVDSFMEKGFTYFDTAYVYHMGKSEEALREVLVKRYDRSSYTITDKLPMFMILLKGQMEKIFNEQLKRLGVDYIDYYWLHALNKREYEKSKKLGAFDFIRKLKQEGKVKHIGFSFHDTADVLETILEEQPDMEYVQLQINYLDWNDEKVQSKKCYDVCVKHNKPVIVMEPVRGGKLANVPERAEKLFKDYNKDASPASWAIRYVASLENVYMVLSGMSNFAQLEDNTNYMKEFVPLNEDEQLIVKEVAKIVKEENTIPCTGCKYCVEGCPMKINIPAYFEIYNNSDNERKKKEAYDELVKNGSGRAEDCLKCGKCENACPQHLKIRDLLEKTY